MPHTAPTIRIYHIEGRRSFRVAWLCEELGLDYELLFEPGDLMASMRRLRSEFPAMPMAPVMLYGDQPVVESGAIVEILTMRHGGGRMMPAIESEDYLRHAQWMHFAEGTLMARGNSDRMMAMMLNVDVDQVPQGYRKGMPLETPMLTGMRGLFDYMEEYLEAQPFFGGAAFSAADIMMHYGIRGAKLLVWIDPMEYENIGRWKKLVEARPAYSRAVERTLPLGSNEFGLPEGQPLPFPARPLAPAGGEL